MSYSFPEIFIQSLILSYGKDQIDSILSALNKTPKLFARSRPLSEMHTIDNKADLEKISKDQNYYIQNITPKIIMEKLHVKTKIEPKYILDLCASPGGKLIQAHDFYPKATLFANDSSKKRMRTLKDNLKKYQIDAHLSCLKGEEYVSSTPFDLIILDVPCSNSGVFHKRPEARWRLSENSVFELTNLQGALIKKGLKLLSDQAVIWYMTCSIMQDENEKIVKKSLKETDYVMKDAITVLPDDTGKDGGFGCLIQKQ